MPSVAWSQVNETNPSPYDQVFILSEAVINQSFQAMFPMPVPFSRQDKEAVRTRQTGQWISNGMVSAPQVSIHVEERSPAYLTLFTLPFTSGMIHLRTSPRGARDTFQNFPLGGWKLVFKTRIGKHELFARNERENDALANTIGMDNQLAKFSTAVIPRSPSIRVLWDSVTRSSSWPNSTLIHQARSQSVFFCSY